MLPEGAKYIPCFVSEKVQNQLIQEIDTRNWRHDLRRRVQHYGFRYDYRARSIDVSDQLGPLPNWLRPTAEELMQKGLFAEFPNQVIVNEYLPGQGISAHVDCEPCFGDAIASLSLLSGCVMKFSRDGAMDLETYLEIGSLILLSGPARWKWKHQIPARKSDFVGSERLERSRRVSITFRNAQM